MLSNFFSTLIVSLTLISAGQSFIFRKSEATVQIRDLPSNSNSFISQSPQVKRRVIPFGKRLDLTIEIPQSGKNYTVSTGSVTINQDLKVVRGNSTKTSSGKINVDQQTLVSTNSTSTDSGSETTTDSDIVTVWGQCGGEGYTGSTTCEEGTSCVATSEWYSECKPVTLATSNCDNPVAVWGQCGGSDFTGSTCCAAGNTCVKQSEYYSQCTPASDASDIAASSVSALSTTATTTTSDAPKTTTTSAAAETTTTTSDAPKTTTTTTSDIPETTTTTTTKQKEVQTTTTTTQAAVETTTTTTTTTTTHKPHTTTTTTTTTSEPAQTSSSSSGSGSGSGEVTGGFATFFYQGGAAGACGTVHLDSDFIVAQQTETYDGGVNCGKTVKITNNDNGKSVTAVVADECPGCPNANSLDLSVATFDAIADEATGIVPITWEYI